MTDERHIYSVKAFTTDPAGGNPAGVVPEADGLTEAQMQDIARQMGFPETAFVLPTEVAGADFRLRWFTPKLEVHLCGHATVATLKVLTSLERFPLDGSPRKIESLSGILRVSAAVEGKRQLHRLQVPLPEFEEYDLPTEELKSLFGFYQSDLDPLLPAVRDKYGPFIPAMGLSTLGRLRPDFARLRHHDTLGTACFFSPDTFNQKHDWHLRFFAPGFGIDEDPVTGAINGPMGAFWYQFVDTVKPPRAEYIGEQGDFIESAGRVYVTVEGDGNKATDIEIGGEAVIFKDEPLSDVLARVR